ncbi:hypothetical protein [Actinosynnema pretiosum]|uniref:hypothetical protein n=1 Tax=Actinosynnema pretiosum TaxID=42197 RepID=UPI0012FE66BE|nr:hypothetical protein [Actinosynnema pretiosum]
MRRTLSPAVVITALAAVATPTASAAPDTSPPPVRWGPREHPVPAVLECARVKVPLDYRDPRGLAGAGIRPTAARGPAGRGR